MASGKIQDSQLSSSSMFDGHQIYSAKYARLNSTGGAKAWIPARGDNDPWIQVDFLEMMTVFEIQTQGRHNYDQYVKTFRLSFGNDVAHLQDYAENGKTKIFSGNLDGYSIARIKLPTVIEARYIRVHPLTSRSSRAMRVEFFGCVDYCASNPCNNGGDCFPLAGGGYNCSCGTGFAGKNCEICPSRSALGMTSGDIRDSQIIASSSYDLQSAPRFARQNLTGSNETTGAWVPAENSTNPWLQVDFNQGVKITEIQTQGRSDLDEWVTTYTVSSGNDGTSFVDYTENDQVKVFSGNNDRNSIVSHVLSTSVGARFLRIHPKTWNGRAALRLEFYGCMEFDDPCEINPCKNGGTCKAIGTIYACQCINGYIGTHCEIACVNRTALGMANGRILDSQVSASSVFNSLFKAEHARLNREGVANVSSGAWIAHGNDSEPWLQVDFLEQMTVVEIQTQGRAKKAQWVTSYAVSYSDDGVNFQNYKKNKVTKVFLGNSDNSSTAVQLLSPVIFSRYIRIHPKTWVLHPAMRTEFIGCFDVDFCLSSPCQNGGTCNTKPGGYSCLCDYRFITVDCKYCLNQTTVGVANGNIQDSQITASSEFDNSFKAHFGRLNNTLQPFVGNGAWRALDSDQYPWLQVDLLKKVPVLAVETQGEPIQDGWVKNFAISYGDNETYFLNYTENRQKKVFTGNNDSASIVRQTLPAPISARFIRIHPLVWSGFCALRVELYGCFGFDHCTSNPCHNGGTCIPSPGGYDCDCVRTSTGTYLPPTCQAYMSYPSGSSYSSRGSYSSGGSYSHGGSYSSGGSYPRGGSSSSGSSQNSNNNPVNYCAPFPCQNGGSCTSLSSDFRCSCLRGFVGVNCEACQLRKALGMANGEIPDSHITASSIYDHYYKPEFGRLNLKYLPFKHRGAWAADVSDFSPWLQVDLNETKTVTEIETQGRSFYSFNSWRDWITNYTLSYSDDGSTFQNFTENGKTKIFSGNSDSDSIVNHKLSSPIVARYIRVNPKTWNQHPSMRVEFYGCFAVDYCSPDPCQNGGSCSLSVSGYLCSCAAGFAGANCEIDFCSPNPCQNGGTCLHSPGGHSCNCGIGFTGENCQINDTATSSTANTFSPTSTEFPVTYPSTVHPRLSNPTSTVPLPTSTTAYPTTGPSTAPNTIIDFLLIPISAHAFGQLISVAWNITQGANVSVRIFYNDIQCCTFGPLNTLSGQCDCLVSDPGRFDPDGLVDIRGEAWNLASNASSVIHVEVLKAIHTASIIMLTSFSEFGSGVPGRGNLQNIFPVEYPVKFNASYLGGPARVIEWTFTCSISGVMKENQFSFDKIFPNNKNELCEISLVLKNNVSTVNASRTMELKESIMVTSFINNGPLRQNQTMTFTISLEKFGTNTCMTVDMGDNSSLLVFGEASCEGKFDVSLINPNIVMQPRMLYFQKNSTTKQIVIHHRYPYLGIYEAKLNARNDVSMVTQAVVAVVLEYNCQNPNVTIKGLVRNSTNVLNAAQVYRSESIALLVETELNCEKTDETAEFWTISKFDDDLNILKTVPGLTVGNLRKSPYRTGLSSPDLLLPERDLPYGFYEITVRVEMKGSRDVFGTDVLYIEVVQTPWIKASVTTGSFYTVPFGYLGSLDASSSIDPDFIGTNGMTFAWYCRDVDDDEFLLSNLTQEVVISIPRNNDSSASVLSPISNSSGCFGTGRGRLNTTSRILELDTRNMVEDKTFAISLVISKNHSEFGLRRGLSTIYFYVAAGLPPKLETSCSKNCQSKVMPDEKIILTSSCSSLCYGKLVFSWSLYLYDNVSMPEPYNLTILNEISQKALRDIVLNPVNELELAIKPNSLQAGKKYIMAFRATRPTGVYGEMRYTMLTNQPPVDGSCMVTPSSGVALNTNFTISCENWTDPDSPLTYEFSYGSKERKVMFFYRTIASGQKISLTNWLPMGDEQEDFKLNITITITDSLRSKASQEVTIKVIPPPREIMDPNRLYDIIFGDTNLLKHLIDVDKEKQAISLASTITSVLNFMAKNTSSNGSVSMEPDLDKFTIKQTKLKILNNLANLTSNETSSLMQISSTVRVLTERTDELTSDVKNAAVTVCESLTDSLKVISDADSGFQNVHKGASNLLDIIGPLVNDQIESSEIADDVHRVLITRSINVVERIENVLLSNLVSNEGPVNVEAEQLSLQVEKVTVESFGNKPNKLKNSQFIAPSAAALGLGYILYDANNTFLQKQAVNIKMCSFNKNPFTWDNSSQNITSKVIDILLDSNLNISSSNLSEDVTIRISRDSSQFRAADSFFLKPSVKNTTANITEYLKYHCFTRRSNYTSMNFEVHPEDAGIHFNVYLKKDGKPNIKSKDFDVSFQLPDLSSCNVNDENVFSSQAPSNSSDQNQIEPIYIDLKNCSRDPYTIFVSNVDFNGTGEYCFAVQHIQYLENFTLADLSVVSNVRPKRSVSCEVGKRRVRRSCVIIPPAPPKPTAFLPILILSAENLGFDGLYFFPNQTPNYNMTMFESSCVFWDVVNETWRGEGCKVVPGTNKDEIICRCNHLTSFGSDLLVAPNPIDFDSVFANFGSVAENVAVLALISTILGSYVIGVLWARRADKKDLLMLGPTNLRKPKGSYHYLITLYTGNRQQAGTTARVVFKMWGDEQETNPVRLRDRHRPCFQRGQDNAFVVSYPKGVGDLSYVQIWHDNTGSSPSWYLSRLSIRDIQSGKVWLFVCENWLAVESQDGKVCRVLPVANDQELTNFSHVFTKRAVKGLLDGHLWFSIFSRPPASNFTRVQRLSCALCLLCCTMIASAMFFNMGGQGPSPFTIRIGSLVIDLKPFVIGLQSSVIIVPVNVAIVQIFRNLRPKKEKKKKDADSDDEGDEIKKKIQLELKQEQTPKGKLPHWFIYVAYALCYLASGASIFFTLLYSIQWGKETSTEWVVTMITSFFQSVLLLQPIKVVLVAVVFALLIRKPSDSSEEPKDVPAVEKKEEDCSWKDKLMKMKSKKRMKRYYSYKFSLLGGETGDVTVQTIHASCVVWCGAQTTGIPSGGDSLYDVLKAKSLFNPPDEDKLQRARVKRLKEIKMSAAIKEIIAFFLFLILLMEVAHYHRDPNTFLLTKTLSETFEELDAYGIDLAAVSDLDSLWMWARETLIPGLYAEEWYNGEKVKKGYLANMEDYLVGIPRVRLLRVKKDSCPLSSYFEDSISHCYGGYSVTNEEDETFEVSWEPLASGSSRKRRDTSSPGTEKEWFDIMEDAEYFQHNEMNSRQRRAMDPISSSASGKNRRKKKRLLKSASPKTYDINDNAILPNGKIVSCLERWRHQTMIELRGFPSWGAITMYSGSGYMANLGYNKITAYTVVSDLHSNGWIDVQTRAVFVEFTVYNANTNLFGIISIFIEFPPSSSAVTSVQYHAARFYLHLTFGETLAHVLVIFFMLYFLYREGKLVYKLRREYFKGFWNWVETILIFSEIGTIVLFLARLYEVDRNLLQLRENPNDYVGFQYAGSADASLMYVLGVLVFFYTLRFLRLLRFNKNFLVIGKTLSRVSSPILSFCLPFFFGFIAFGLLAFAVFGSELEDYSSFMRTLVTQFSMTLGDFDFEALVMTNSVIAPLYFFAFVGLNVFVLMNMFIAIINDSFAEIQDETAELENELEIINYVSKKFVKGIHGKAKRKRRRKKKRKNKSASSSATSECFDELDFCGERLDDMMDVIDGSLKQDDLFNERFCSVSRERKQDLFFRVLCLMESLDDDHDYDDEELSNGDETSDESDDQ